MNVATPSKSGSRIVDEARPPLQNIIVDIGSTCTSLSALPLSVASWSFSTATDAKSIADDMAKSLHLPGSR